MKPSLRLPFTFVSALLLSACGTRSSLPDPDPTEVDTECEAWSVRDGVPADGWSSPTGPFALLGDGSVVLPLLEVDGATSLGSHSLQKIEADGELAWGAALPDVAGSALVAGHGTDTVFFFTPMPSGAAVFQGAKLPCPTGARCAFIGKVAETGTLLWSKAVPAFEPGSGTVPMALAVSRDGRIAVVGRFEDTIDLGCGPLTATGTDDYPSRFLAELSPSGECLWSRAIVGTPELGNPDARDGIAVGDDGDVAVVVLLPKTAGAQTIDLGGGPVPFDTSQGAGFALAKYAPDGDLVFARVVSGVVEDPGTKAAPAGKVVVTSAGEVLLSMGHEGEIDLGGGPRGVTGTVRHFVTKLDASGKELWTRDIAARPSSVLPPEPFSIALGHDGGFFLAGRGQPGMKILGEETGYALFFAEYDASGEPLDVRTFPVGDHGIALLTALSVSADGTAVLAGTFEGSLDFGQEPLVAEDRGVTFVAKICP